MIKDFFDNMSSDGKIFLGFIAFVIVLICAKDARDTAKEKKRAQYQRSFPSYSSYNNYSYPSYTPTYPTSRDHYVKPYYRSDGTYVPGHRRTNSDFRHSNNYSSYGNTNPYNGKRGYK